jgi:hypothetical protein
MGPVGGSGKNQTAESRQPWFHAQRARPTRLSNGTMHGLEALYREPQTLDRNSLPIPLPEHHDGKKD